MRKFLQTIATAVSFLIITFGISACGGGGGGGPTQSPGPSPTTSPTGTPTPSPTISPTPTPDATVEISGTVTYDFVPHRDVGTPLQVGSLYYLDTDSNMPVRNATIALLSDNDDKEEFLAWSRTDENGRYSFTVGTNTAVKVRVLAELKSDTGANYDIKVTDNVNGNALYVMEGSVASSGTENSIRDLHAPSGWTGAEYGETRVAAPFAILDSVWQAVEALIDSQPAVSLPSVELRWSTENIAIDDNPADGKIGTSYFDGTNIYLLGHEDNDTDEYDRSIVQHEFAHYLNDKLTRDDSIGGIHGGTTPIDMRVAYSEGSANAFTALVSGTGYYEDSYGTAQSNGFRDELENNTLSTTGFFSEDTSGQLIYDLFDGDVDGNDDIELSMNLFFQTLMDADYQDAVAFTSLYLFIDVLRAKVTGPQNISINSLLDDHKMYGTGIYGEGETNADDYDFFALPIYRELSVNSTVEVCMESQLINATTGDYNNFNGITVRRFARFSVDQNATYSVSAQKTSGARITNPGIYIFRNGRPPVAEFESGTSNTESGNATLTAGDYIMEIFDKQMIDGGDSTNFSQVCFNVSISQ